MDTIAKSLVGAKLLMFLLCNRSLCVGDALKESNDSRGGFGVKSVEWSWIEAERRHEPRERVV